MLGRSWNEWLAASASLDPFGDAAALIDSRDLTVINLETAITSETRKVPGKTFNFRLDPSLARRVLGRWRGRLHVNLANNHVLDYGPAGLAETLAVLDELGISHSGAGMNAEQATAPRLWTSPGGFRIGFLSAADHPAEWEAGTAPNSRPGISYVDIQGGPDTWRPLLARVRALVRSGQVDAVVVSLHHGANWVRRVPPLTVEFFRALVAAGAAIVHGHSAHHVLPVERSANKALILYGAGDMIDDYAVDAEFRNDLAFLADVRLAADAGSLAVRLLPTRIQSLSLSGPHQLHLLTPADPDARRVLVAAARPV